MEAPFIGDVFPPCASADWETAESLCAAPWTAEAEFVSRAGFPFMFITRLPLNIPENT